VVYVTEFEVEDKAVPCKSQDGPLGHRGLEAFIIYRKSAHEDGKFVRSKKVKGHLWVLQHLCLEGVLYSYPNEFLHSSPEALHTKRRERPLLAKEGRNYILI
jgi:hypothetical protein